MDPRLFYAISAGGGILLLFFINIITHPVWFLEPCWKLIWKYFLLPILVGNIVSFSRGLLHKCHSIWSISAPISSVPVSKRWLPRSECWHSLFIVDQYDASLLWILLWPHSWLIEGLANQVPFFLRIYRDLGCSVWIAPRPDWPDR